MSKRGTGANRNPQATTHTSTHINNQNNMDQNLLQTNDQPHLIPRGMSHGDHVHNQVQQHLNNNNPQNPQNNNSSFVNHNHSSPSSALTTNSSSGNQTLMTVGTMVTPQNQHVLQHQQQQQQHLPQANNTNTSAFGDTLLSPEQLELMLNHPLPFNNQPNATLNNPFSHHNNHTATNNNTNITHPPLPIVNDQNNNNNNPANTSSNSNGNSNVNTSINSTNNINGPRTPNAGPGLNNGNPLPPPIPITFQSFQTSERTQCALCNVVLAVQSLANHQKTHEKYNECVASGVNMSTLWACHECKILMNSEGARTRHYNHQCPYRYQQGASKETKADRVHAERDAQQVIGGSTPIASPGSHTNIPHSTTPNNHHHHHPTSTKHKELTTSTTTVTSTKRADKAAEKAERAAEKAERAAEKAAEKAERAERAKNRPQSPPPTHKASQQQQQHQLPQQSVQSTVTTQPVNVPMGVDGSSIIAQLDGIVGSPSTSTFQTIAKLQQPTTTIPSTIDSIQHLGNTANTNNNNNNSTNNNHTNLPQQQPQQQHVIGTTSTMMSTLGSPSQQPLRGPGPLSPPQNHQQQQQQQLLGNGTILGAPQTTTLQTQLHLNQQAQAHTQLPATTNTALLQSTIQSALHSSVHSPSVKPLLPNQHNYNQYMNQLPHGNQYQHGTMLIDSSLQTTTAHPNHPSAARPLGFPSTNHPVQSSQQQQQQPLGSAGSSILAALQNGTLMGLHNQQNQQHAPTTTTTTTSTSHLYQQPRPVTANTNGVMPTVPSLLTAPQQPGGTFGSLSSFNHHHNHHHNPHLPHNPLATSSFGNNNHNNNNNNHPTNTALSAGIASPSQLSPNIHPTSASSLQFANLINLSNLGTLHNNNNNNTNPTNHNNNQPHGILANAIASASVTTTTPSTGINAVKPMINLNQNNIINRPLSGHLYSLAPPHQVSSFGLNSTTTLPNTGPNGNIMNTGLFNNNTGVNTATSRNTLGSAGSSSSTAVTTTTGIAAGLASDLPRANSNGNGNTTTTTTTGNPPLLASANLSPNSHPMQPLQNAQPLVGTLGLTSFTTTGLNAQSPLQKPHQTTTTTTTTLHHHFNPLNSNANNNNNNNNHHQRVLSGNQLILGGTNAISGASTNNLGGIGLNAVNRIMNPVSLLSPNGMLLGPPGSKLPTQSTQQQQQQPQQFGTLRQPNGNFSILAPNVPQGLPGQLIGSLQPHHHLHHHHPTQHPHGPSTAFGLGQFSFDSHPSTFRGNYGSLLPHTTTLNGTNNNVNNNHQNPNSATSSMSPNPLHQHNNLLNHPHHHNGNIMHTSLPQSTQQQLQYQTPNIDHNALIHLTPGQQRPAPNLNANNNNNNNNNAKGKKGPTVVKPPAAPKPPVPPKSNSKKGKNKNHDDETEKTPCPRCFCHLSLDSIKQLNSTHNQGHLRYEFNLLNDTPGLQFPCHPCRLDFLGAAALTQHLNKQCPHTLGTITPNQIILINARANYDDVDIPSLVPGVNFTQHYSTHNSHNFPQSTATNSGTQGGPNNGDLDVLTRSQQQKIEQSGNGTPVYGPNSGKSSGNGTRRSGRHDGSGTSTPLMSPALSQATSQTGNNNNNNNGQKDDWMVFQSLPISAVATNAVMIMNHNNLNGNPIDGNLLPSATSQPLSHHNSQQHSQQSSVPTLPSSQIYTSLLDNGGDQNGKDNNTTGATATSNVLSCIGAHSTPEEIEMANKLHDLIISIKSSPNGQNGNVTCPVCSETVKKNNFIPFHQPLHEKFLRRQALFTQQHTTLHICNLCRLGYTQSIRFDEHMTRKHAINAVTPSPDINIVGTYVPDKSLHWCGGLPISPPHVHAHQVQQQILNANALQQQPQHQQQQQQQQISISPPQQSIPITITPPTTNTTTMASSIYPSPPHQQLPPNSSLLVSTQPIITPTPNSTTTLLPATAPLTITDNKQQHLPPLPSSTATGVQSTSCDTNALSGSSLIAANETNGNVTINNNPTNTTPPPQHQQQQQDQQPSNVTPITTTNNSNNNNNNDNNQNIINPIQPIKRTAVTAQLQDYSSPTNNSDDNTGFSMEEGFSNRTTPLDQQNNSTSDDVDVNNNDITSPTTAAINTLQNTYDGKQNSPLVGDLSLHSNKKPRWSEGIDANNINAIEAMGDHDLNDQKGDLQSDVVVGNDGLVQLGASTSTNMSDNV